MTDLVVHVYVVSWCADLHERQGLSNEAPACRGTVISEPSKSGNAAHRLPGGDSDIPMSLMVVCRCGHRWEALFCRRLGANVFGRLSILVWRAVSRIFW